MNTKPNLEKEMKTNMESDFKYAFGFKRGFKQGLSKAEKIIKQMNLTTSSDKADLILAIKEAKQ